MHINICIHKRRKKRKTGLVWELIDNKIHTNRDIPYDLTHTHTQISIVLWLTLMFPLLNKSNWSKMRKKEENPPLLTGATAMTHTPLTEFSLWHSQLATQHVCRWTEWMTMRWQLCERGEEWGTKGESVVDRKTRKHREQRRDSYASWLADDERCRLSMAARLQQGSFKRPSHAAQTTAMPLALCKRQWKERDRQRERENKTYTDLKNVLWDRATKPHRTGRWGDWEGVPD